MRETDDGDWELQSAHVKYTNDAETCEIDLIATVHVGEEEYYGNLERELTMDPNGSKIDFDDDDFCEEGGNDVLFELLTDERNIDNNSTTNSNTNDSNKNNKNNNEQQQQQQQTRGRVKLNLPRLKVSLSPTLEARQLAASHGLVAQLDAIDFKKPNWYLADCSSNELEKMKASMNAEDSDTETFRVPALVEAFLVTVVGRARTLPRAGQFARALVWLVPCPEAHLLLLDWVWGGGRPAPVLGAMVDAISAGDIVGARKLAFAQMIVSAQGKNDVYGSSSGAKATIEKRNEVATERLREALRQMCEEKTTKELKNDNKDAETKRKLSILYGGSHLPGLAKNLETLDIAALKGGGKFSKSSTTWRTVWRIPKKPENSVARFGFLPFLLLVDGFDWASALDALTEVPTRREKLLETFLYVLRHVAAYYALGKWVLEWNRDLFEESRL